jgi:uncharacterized repeat protein (TIGR01451 family)
MIRPFLAGLLVLFFSQVAVAQTIRSASGSNPADITTARDLFRADLGGGAVAGANGSFGGVRREINWDGVPDGSSAPNALPNDFFNVNSPRGVVFATPGTGFQVSATAASGTPVEFGNIDPSYPATFQTFSPERLFTPLGSNVTDIRFFVPGTTAPATVTGFGAVFTDVDTVATIELFDIFSTSLGVFNVPVSPSGGLSFLGVSDLPGGPIFHVRITTGNAALGAGVVDGVGTDLVVMDDFIYSEPLTVAAIGLVKLTNGLNNDTAPGPAVPVGSLVSFTYNVTNPGFVTLSGVTVRDDNGTPLNLLDDFDATFVGGDGNASGQLESGETWIFTASRFATAGQHTNTATASGTAPAGPGVSDTDVDNHFGVPAAINVVKLTNGTNNDTAPGPSVPVGSLVTFTYVVTNPGPVTLSGVTVRDDNGTPLVLGDDFNATFVGGDANANGQLESTETWTFTASRLATAGQYTNIATASGTPAVGPVATDTDVDNHFGQATSSVATSIPTLDPSMLLLLAAIMFGIGVMRMRV